jgi:hypothetical protein
MALYTMGVAECVTYPFIGMSFICNWPTERWRSRSAFYMASRRYLPFERTAERFELANCSIDCANYLEPKIILVDSTI